MLYSSGISPRLAAACLRGCLQDLLLWTNWIRDKRIEEPAGLVVLGSDNVAAGQSDHHQCTKEAVIWESGLDNSPMCKRDSDICCCCCCCAGAVLVLHVRTRLTVMMHGVGAALSFVAPCVRQQTMSLRLPGSTHHATLVCPSARAAAFTSMTLE
jgi:hypothetical protein